MSCLHLCHIEATCQHINQTEYSVYHSEGVRQLPPTVGAKHSVPRTGDLSLCTNTHLCPPQPRDRIATWCQVLRFSGSDDRCQCGLRRLRNENEVTEGSSGGTGGQVGFLLDFRDTEGRGTSNTITVI